MHLLSIQMQWMMFTKILMIIIQAEKEKILIVFDDMIADIMKNKISSNNQRIIYEM